MNAIHNVTPAGRNEFLDITRGFAVLGILVMNIIAFGLPKASYYNPVIDGADQGANLLAYALASLFAEGTMRALFSLLFGASICMLGDKLNTIDYLRRYSLLLLIGLFDIFVLLWSGDVLYDYAVAGMLLYFVRNISPAKLLGGATGLILIMITVQAFWAADLRSDDSARHTKHQGLIEYLNPEKEKLEKEARQKEQPYLSQVRLALAPSKAWNHLVANFLTGRIWDTLIAMLLGMWLYRLGLMGQRRLSRKTLVYSVATFGLAGLVINGAELYFLLRSGFAPQWLFPSFMPSYQSGRFCMTFAYLALIALWLQSPFAKRLKNWIASTGRLALSNYLLQSLLGLLLFTQGLALYNQLSRAELLLMLPVIWIVQIAFSHFWLKHHRFGPVEWLWRYASTGVRPTV
jgi:uncharacterized protein